MKEFLSLLKNLKYLVLCLVNTHCGDNCPRKYSLTLPVCEVDGSRVIGISHVFVRFVSTCTSIFNFSIQIFS